MRMSGRIRWMQMGLRVIEGARNCGVKRHGCAAGAPVIAADYGERDFRRGWGDGAWLGGPIPNRFVAVTGTNGKTDHG